MLRTAQVVSSILATAIVLAQLADSAPLRCDPNACISRLSKHYFDIACSAGQCFGCRWAEGGLRSLSEDDYVFCKAVKETSSSAQAALSSSRHDPTLFEPNALANSASEVDLPEELQSEDLDKWIAELVKELSRPLQIIDSSNAEYSSSSSSSSGSSYEMEEMPAWLRELFSSVDDPELQQALADEVQDLFIDSRTRARSIA